MCVDHSLRLALKKSLRRKLSKISHVRYQPSRVVCDSKVMKVTNTFWFGYLAEYPAKYRKKYLRKSY